MQKDIDGFYKLSDYFLTSIYFTQSSAPYKVNIMPVNQETNIKLFETYIYKPNNSFTLSDIYNTVTGYSRIVTPGLQYTYRFDTTAYLSDLSNYFIDYGDETTDNINVTG